METTNINIKRGDRVKWVRFDSERALVFSARFDNSVCKLLGSTFTVLEVIGDGSIIQAEFESGMPWAYRTPLLTEWVDLVREGDEPGLAEDISGVDVSEVGSIDDVVAALKGGLEFMADKTS